MSGGEEHRYVRADAVGLEGLMNQRDSRTVGCLGIAPTFEHTSIAALEAEREHIKSHIGPGFVYNTYHSKRHSHPTYEQTVGKCAPLYLLADGRRQGGHVAHIGGYGAESVGRKPQAVIERRVGTHARKVGGIGFKQGADIVFDKPGKRQDDCIALGVSDIGDGAGRLSHRPEQRVDFGHVGYAK